MANFLTFKLWGDYAHFKKFYTTTSPLTFEMPPPPTVIGIISAIIGLDREVYLEGFQDPDRFKLSVCLDRPVKKVRWTQNLIDTKRHFWNIQGRTQIRIEFLKDPAYTIHFHHSNSEIHDSLRQRLENHESVYSVSLGLSELLANFEFVGEADLQPQKCDDPVDLNSAVPYSRLADDRSIDFSACREIFKVNYPIWMGTDRVVNFREPVFLERNAGPMRCRVKEFYETPGGDRIVVF